MPVGVLCNAAAILIGGILGGLFGRFFPQRIREALPVTFGICAMAIGISLIPQAQNFPPVVMAIIVGTLLGEGIQLEDKISALTLKLKALASKGSGTGEDDGKLTQLVSVLVLFCTSGTGILGALTEGMTGDATVLLSKSVLDLFTALIFAASLGAIVAWIAIPQCILFTALFFAGGLLAPWLTSTAILDFSACGGILTFAIGIRISELRAIRVANMTPALVLILPFSLLWQSLLG